MLIDLNKRSLEQSKYKDDFYLSEAGIPICKKNLPMKDNGYDHTRDRCKYRCPLIEKGVFTCEYTYTPSPYSRCIYTYPEDNLRLFPPIAQDSNECKNAYKRRTTAERSKNEQRLTICWKLPGSLWKKQAVFPADIITFAITRF